VIDGDAAQREHAAREDCHFYTVSVDNLAWLCTLFKKKWPYDMVILDESSMFKSHTSQRFKLLRRCRPYINYLVELTATPAAEGY
ncbi:ATP-dependent helicase, partial [Salmonella enterica]